MTDTITAYPLAWPPQYRRTNAPDRKASPFGERRIAPTVQKSVGFLFAELRKLGADNIVVSTNLQLRLDGLPLSERRVAADPGAAVYFTLNKEPRVLACDKWITVGENIWAIALHIQSVRGQERWGVGSLDQAFAGYAQLPARAGEHWRDVFNLAGADVTIADIDRRFRALADEYHPDHGGTTDDMARLNTARRAALEDLGARERTH